MMTPNFEKTYYTRAVYDPISDLYSLIDRDDIVYPCTKEEYDLFISESLKKVEDKKTIRREEIRAFLSAFIDLSDDIAIDMIDDFFYRLNN